MAFKNKVLPALMPLMLLSACLDGRTGGAHSLPDLDGIYVGNWQAASQFESDAVSKKVLDSNVIIHGNSVTVTDGQFVATGRLRSDQNFEATTGPHFSLQDDDTRCTGKLVFSGSVDTAVNDLDVEAIVVGKTQGSLNCVADGVPIVATLSGHFESVKQQTISKIFVPTVSLLDLLKHV
ncbi:hypothetical protein GCM10008090_12380 [Arenicella chitinivorans]|uniref:Uncharacterized protein n=1 Tax=Arenicella chitinivorans TaxID=1329800 RepID=A0A918RL75_9GAMM|nr:hypothetical protein [Arenicella chitinivorans]GHA04523.1 hypothetical protein GCM10008090_12380 [Arenicella chitinivorans]